MNGIGKILVIGGYGYLGSYISEAFLRTGYEVWILGREKQWHLDHYAHHFISCDIREGEELRQILDGFNFQLVVNASGQANHRSKNYAEKATAIHINGTKNILKHTGTNAYIQLSSFHVYGKYDGTLSKQSETNPQNKYGQVLLGAEQIVRQHCDLNNTSFLILRMSNGYGKPHSNSMTQWQLLHNSLCRSLAKEELFELESDPELQRDFIYLGDAASIIKNLFEQDKVCDTTLNLSRGKSHSIREIVSGCKRAAQEINLETNIQLRETENPDSFRIDNSELLNLVSYKFSDVFEREAGKTIQDLMETFSSKPIVSSI